MKLQTVTFLVRDYDEAIVWFVQKLSFVLREDVKLSDEKRWVKIAAGDDGFSLLLAKAEGVQQIAAIGNAAGGRVAYFLHVNDFSLHFQRLKSVGVRFREEPRYETYGTVAVFEDLYGNGWDLIGPARNS